jgi:WD40 repeat protein
MVMSPDKRRLAIDRQLWNLTLCDITDGTEKVLFEKHDSSIRLPTFSPDGSNFAVVVGDTVIRVWDSSTLTVVGESQQHSARIISFVFSPDRTRIISICSNNADSFDWTDKDVETRVQIWNIIEGPDIVTLDCRDIVRSVAFFPNAVQFITMSYNGTIQTWSITHTPVLLSTLSGSVHHDTMVISPDGTQLLTFNPSRREPYLLFDLLNQKALEVQAHFAIQAAVFSPDSSHIACYSVDLRIIDAANGILLHRFNNKRAFELLAFSPDSTRLLCLSQEGNIRIFYTEHLPTFVDIKISYPEDRMVTRKCPYIATGTNADISNGWYCGENGAHLIWLPKHMRHIWLTMHRSFVLEQNAREVTILDMTDYLDAVPPARVAWRDGGIRYTSSDAEVAAAYASVGR